MNGRSNSIAFTPGRIGKIALKNRLVRSATYENAATPQGEVSEELIEIYGDLAEGGVGLIISGITAVHPKGISMHRILRLDADMYIKGLKKIPLAVRSAAPDCKIMLQLYHPGRQVLNRQAAMKMNSALPPAMLAYIKKHPDILSTKGSKHEAVDPIAPSAVYDNLFERTPRALSLEEIDGIIESFADAVRRAETAGFDGVQLHAAHGYLLCSFLSPRTNKREDAYGGSTENRTRIVREIYHRAKKRVDADFPILIKFNVNDFLPDGTDVEEAVRVGKILHDTGFAAVETSGGMWETVTQTKEVLGWRPYLLAESRTGIKNKEQEGYFLPGAKALKKETNATVMLVGGLRSIGRIEEVLSSGAADFVSLCRPLIRQPDLPNLWRSGSIERAECISCNACLPAGLSPLACRAKCE